MDTKELIEQKKLNYNMLPKILIIEDETKVANFIKNGLEENEYEAIIENNGLTGCETALNQHFDLIILDINLPDLSGFEVCKNIRKVNLRVPILILTAYSATSEKLIGFDAGADDYLVKPFNFEELLARIRALLKRVKNQNPETNILKVADLELNLDTKTARRNNIKIELTGKEFLLLEYLMQNKGKVISRIDIAEKIWDITFDTGTNVIDVYVNFLRKKIDKNFSPKLIHTVIGMGYMLNENED